MLLKPMYHEVVAPFRVWRRIGTSASQTYVGRSMALTTVRDAVDAKPGDELHLLPGGVFVTGPDGAFQVDLKPPVHVFESRHHYVPDEQLVRELTSAGRVRTLAGPKATIDFKAVRDAFTAARFPPMSGEERRVDPSPERRLAREVIDRLVAVLDEAGVAYSRAGADVTAYKAAHDGVTLEDGHVQAMAVVGRVTVAFSEGLAPMIDVGTARDGVRHVAFQDSFVAASHASAMVESIGRKVGREVAPSPGM